jgi:hypothetical protein
MLNAAKCLINNATASTAVEYALIFAGIALAGYAALNAVGSLIAVLFSGAGVNLLPHPS